MGDGRVAIFASFVPKPDHERQVETVLRGMVAQTRLEPGCLLYDLYRAQAGNSLHLFEVYRDRTAVDAHRATEHYKEYRTTISDLLAEPIAVAVLDEVDAAPNYN
jgi:quinol monooxygenase YgiN